VAPEGVTLMLGDCIDRMAEISSGSIDLIAADLPYGTTACKWDAVIPFGPMWAEYRRVLSKEGAVVLTASQPFTSSLLMSNPSWYRHRWVWDKVNRITGYLDAKRRPLRVAEDILIFAPGRITYNPQMTPGDPYTRKRSGEKYRPDVYGDIESRTDTVCDGSRFPQDILSIRGDQFGRDGSYHATQKPVELFEYLILTYSNEGGVVLDNAMGSGTTGVASLNTNRKFIGIESDPEVFAVAERRLSSRGFPVPSARRRALDPPQSNPCQRTFLDLLDSHHGDPS
jgi:site-specific DNA-methyltransferase (adenine-specific)